MCKPATHTKKDKRSCQSLAKLLFSRTLLTGPSIFSLSRLWTEPYSTECSVLRFHRDESYTCERASYGLVIRLLKGIKTMLGKRKAHADKACSRFSRWKAFFCLSCWQVFFWGLGWVGSLEMEELRSWGSGSVKETRVNQYYHTMRTGSSILSPYVPFQLGTPFPKDNT